jgi:murein DD-endopeptidase MepM/ murein hydrolase activator NlpD
VSAAALLGGGAALALAAPLAVVLVFSGVSDSPAGACGPTSPAVGVEAVNVNAVAGLTPEQLHNAGIVIAVAQRMGLDARDQTTGVMVAIGESGLVNIDVGDAAGPDSRGLFQQRANGAWGSYTDRMDPAIASENFFKALQGVTARAAMSPTAVAHAVQRNQDPNYYTRYFAEAVQIVSNVTGQLVEATTAVPCSASGQAALGSQQPTFGLALPLPRDLLSVELLSRPHHDHPALDIAVPIGTPIYAAKAGTVVTAGGADEGWGTHMLVVRDDEGWSWLYGHGSAVSVSVGQHVEAGQQIGSSGNEGFSTGPHLHVQVTAPGIAPDQTQDVHCPQAELVAAFNGQPGPPMSSLSQSCVSGHLAGSGH